MYFVPSSPHSVFEGGTNKFDDTEEAAEEITTEVEFGEDFDIKSDPDSESESGTSSSPDFPCFSTAMVVTGDGDGEGDEYRLILSMSMTSTRLTKSLLLQT